jgi:hypothetical protein
LQRLRETSRLVYHTAARNCGKREANYNGFGTTIASGLEAKESNQISRRTTKSEGKDNERFRKEAPERKCK